MTMKFINLITLLSALLTGPAIAGNCDMGSAALNIVNKVNYFNSSVNPEAAKTEEYYEIQFKKGDTLHTTFAVDWASGWRKWRKWDRNVVGLIPTDVLDSFNRQSDAVGLNSKSWHANPLDSDTILSAKMNVITAAEFAKQHDLPLQGANSTIAIDTVTPENAEEAGYDILAHTMTAEFRRTREYDYWHSVNQKLFRSSLGHYKSPTIDEIKIAFSEDHPIGNDVADVNGLKKLMMTRLPNGDTLYHKASIGELGNTAIAELTGRPNLASYFLGYCDDATK